MTLRLFRENKPLASRLGLDVLDILGVGVLGLLCWIIAVLVMA